MLALFVLQLKFYATTEHRVGDSQTMASDAGIALNGQYVSNWEDLANSTNSSSKVQFLSDVAIVNAVFLEVLQNTMVACAIFLGLALLYLLHKLLQQGHISIRNYSKSNLFALYLGSTFCICSIGLLMLIAEVITWNMRPTFLDVLIIKHSIIYLITVVPFVCLEVCYFVFIRSNREFFFKTTWKKMLLLVVIFLSSLFYFAILWLIASFLDTLILVIAYPLHAITLIVLHFAFVFVQSIIFAVIVSEFNRVISRRERRKSLFIPKVIIDFCIIFSSCIVCCIFCGCVYFAIIIGYASTIVQRIVPGDGLVQVLFFLPSLILFVFGWLLKRRFFQTGMIYVTLFMYIRKHECLMCMCDNKCIHFHLYRYT